MSVIRVRIDPDDPESLPPGQVDYAVLDATTEEDIARQIREDDAEAMRDVDRSLVGCAAFRVDADGGRASN